MAELKWYNAYDDLSVAVYIIDAVSYELLYLNNRVKSLFPNSKLGSPCFFTFKGNSERCENCPLLPNTDGFTGDFFYLRQRKFPSSSGNLFDVYEGIINWETNRQVCFCVLVDSDSKTELEQLNSTILPSLYMHKLSSQLETVQSLENALSVQEFISNFTQPFTQPHTNFNALIYDAMAALKQYLHADRVYILTMDSETNNLHYLYRLTEDNIATYPNSFAMSLADFAIIESIFEKKSFAYFNDLKTENANIASFFKEAISAIFTLYTFLFIFHKKAFILAHL